MAKQKLWAIKVTHGSIDRGYLVVANMVAAVYSTEEDAAKDAKWLTEFQRKCNGGATYDTIRWKGEEDMKTELQLSKAKKENITYPKMKQDEKDAGGLAEFFVDAPKS